MQNHNAKYKIEQSILRTLAYYDVLGMSLTAREIWRYLISETDAKLGRENNAKEFNLARTTFETRPLDIRFEEVGSLAYVVKTLDVLRQDGRIGERWGYYFLSGQEGLVEERIHRIKIADQKWKKARRAIWWLQMVPFVRAVFASGSLAIENTDEQSDLDVLIVTKSRRIFTARFFVTAMLFLLRAYRHGTRITGRVCTNHYITEDSLEIPFQSLYNAQTYAHLTPIFLRDVSLPHRFFEANRWLTDFINETRLHALNQRSLKRNIFLGYVARIGELVLSAPIGDALEGILRKLQLARIQRNPKTHDPGTGHVVANDRMLAFHPHSPEPQILDKFYKNT